MANINAPSGFVPYNANARSNTYTIASGYATALNIGDPVALTGTGVGDHPSIKIGVAGSEILGIFAGCSYVNSAGIIVKGSWPASAIATSVTATVYDGPLERFVAQMDGSIAVTDYGQKTSFVTGVGAGEPMISGYTLSSSDIGTGTDFIIYGLVPRSNNEIGTYAKVMGYFRTLSGNYPFTAV